MLKPVCHFLIGLPGAGKSTYVKSFLEVYPFYYPDTKLPVVLSTDDYIDTKAQLIGKTYSECFRDFYADAERYMYDQLQEAMIDGRSIVWDQTNLTVNARRKKIALLKDYNIVAVYIREPLMLEWMHRLNSRPGKIIPMNVLMGMQKSLEVPTKEEGFDTILEFSVG